MSGSSTPLRLVRDGDNDCDDLVVVTALDVEVFDCSGPLLSLVGWRATVWTGGHAVPGVVLPQRAIVRVDPVTLPSGTPALELLLRRLPARPTSLVCPVTQRALQPDPGKA